MYSIWLASEVNKDKDWPNKTTNFTPAAERLHSEAQHTLQSELMKNHRGGKSGHIRGQTTAISISHWHYVCVSDCVTQESWVCVFWDKSCLVVFSVAPHTEGEPPCLFVLPFLSFPVTAYYFYRAATWWRWCVFMCIQLTYIRGLGYRIWILLAYWLASRHY